MPNRGAWGTHRGEGAGSARSPSAVAACSYPRSSLESGAHLDVQRGTVPHARANASPTGCLSNGVAPLPRSRPPVLRHWAPPASRLTVPPAGWRPVISPPDACCPRRFRVGWSSETPELRHGRHWVRGRLDGTLPDPESSSAPRSGQILIRRRLTSSPPWGRSRGRARSGLAPSQSILPSARWAPGIPVPWVTPQCRATADRCHPA